MAEKKRRSGFRLYDGVVALLTKIVIADLAGPKKLAKAENWNDAATILTDMLRRHKELDLHVLANPVTAETGAAWTRRLFEGASLSPSAVRVMLRCSWPELANELDTPKLTDKQKDDLIARYRAKYGDL